MSTSQVYVARLAGLEVFDPIGDQVGRVRDVVVVFRSGRHAPRAVGLVVEVPGRRRVFLPMTRITSIDAGQVITTGLVNMRRFEQRATETLVVAELLDRPVTLVDGGGEATVEDVAIAQQRNRDWLLAKVFVRRRSAARFGGRLRRRGETLVVDVDAVTGLQSRGTSQGTANLLAAYEDLRAADLADAMHDMTADRRTEVALALTDERLADVLEELPEDDRVQVMSGLGAARAADVLESMQPDDAADLLGELPGEQAENLLSLMEPEEAAPLRRLLSYDDDTAGGLMTTDPVVLPPEATVAEALAHVRRQELSPALAAGVFVCRPPLETPTGKYLGVAHIQRMLRETPHTPVGALLDREPQALGVAAPLGRVTRHLATYNLVAVPIVDSDGRLLGAVTVDDVLDHTLPADWRERDSAAPEDELGDPGAAQGPGEDRG